MKKHLGWASMLLVSAGSVALLAIGCTGPAEQPTPTAAAPVTTSPTQPAAATPAQTKLPILSAIPNAPPRATPVPTPVGQVAPTPVPLVAAEVKALFLDVNTVTAGAGESRYNVDGDRYCVATSTFKRGMHVVWLMEAYDAGTGKELQAADVKEAIVKLPHGENVSFRYGRHGSTDDAPWFWSAAWDIPPDYPLGVLDFEVAVTSSTDKRATFSAWGAHAPERNITNRVTIIE